MEWKLLPILLILAFTGENSRSFVSTAPLTDVSDVEKSTDDTVKELENLKGLFEKTSKNNDEISVTKSRTSIFVDDNGKTTSHHKLQNKVDKNGKLLARVQEKVDVVKNKNGTPKSVTKTEIEIPSQGIHDFFVKSGERASQNEGKALDNKQNEVEKKKFIPGMEYGPLDMAEYIYWTGDEKNVALMIEEFLEKGLMSRQEAINFLQSIKLNLDYMQARDKSLQKFDKKNSNNLVKTTPNEVLSSPANHEKKEQEYDKLRNFISFDMKQGKDALKASSNDNNEEAMERVRMSDLLYKEYSLEEIIYQLAKVMFTQSLGKGSTEAQSALHKLVTFLQKEVKSGQVSRNLERKLLDVLFAALTDTLTEQTEVMFAEKEGLLDNAVSFPDSGSMESELEDRENVKGRQPERSEIKVTSDN